MDYKTIRMDPIVVEMCTNILPWSTIGMNGPTDIFQFEAEIMDPRREYVQAYTLTTYWSSLEEP